jgi:hypothetical protein
MLSKKVHSKLNTVDRWKVEGLKIGIPCEKLFYLKIEDDYVNIGLDLEAKKIMRDNHYDLITNNQYKIKYNNPRLLHF